MRHAELTVSLWSGREESVELGGGKLGDRPQLDRNLLRERLPKRVNETMRHGQVSWEPLSPPRPSGHGEVKAQPMRETYPSGPERVRVPHVEWRRYPVRDVTGCGVEPWWARPGSSGNTYATFPTWRVGNNRAGVVVVWSV